MHSVVLHELIYVFIFAWPLSFLFTSLLLPSFHGTITRRRKALCYIFGPIGTLALLARPFFVPWRYTAGPSARKLPNELTRYDRLQLLLGWTLIAGLVVLFVSGLVIFFHPGWTEFYFWVIRSHAYFGYLMAAIFLFYTVRHAIQYGSRRMGLIALALMALCFLFIVSLNWFLEPWYLVNIPLIYLWARFAKKFWRDPKRLGSEISGRSGLAILFLVATTFATGFYNAEPFNSWLNNNAGLYILYLHGTIPMLLAPIAGALMLIHVWPRITSRYKTATRRIYLWGLPVFLVTFFLCSAWIDWKFYGPDRGPHVWPPRIVTTLFPGIKAERELYYTHILAPPPPPDGTIPEGYESTLNDFSVCAQPGCHPSLVEQWASSPHRFAASNKFFSRVMERLAEERGSHDLDYFCMNCHDPSLVLKMQRGQGFTPEMHQESDGISCKACHTMASFVDEEMGPWDGKYALRPELSYPVKVGDPDYAKRIQAYIRWDLRLHFRNYSIPDIAFSGQMCAACHVSTMPPFVTGLDKTLTATDLWTSWAKSPYPARGETCVTCHMPERTKDERGFGFPDHSFPGLNVARAMMIDGDEETMEGARREDANVAELLKGNSGWPDTRPFLTLRIDAPAAAVPGDAMSVVVKTTNSGVGHYFHAGPSSLNEVWLELLVKDANAAVVYHSGNLEGEGRVVDPDARRLGATLLDKDGVPIHDCSIWRIATVKGSRRIHPMETVEDSFRISLPEKLAGPLTVEARWNHRRASQQFVDWVYGGTGPTLPTVEIESAQVSVPVAF